jgi:hypothetical protein
MKEQSLEGSWIATSLNSNDKVKYIFMSNNQYEYWSYSDGTGWQQTDHGTYQHFNKELSFSSEGSLPSESIMFALGVDGDKLALGIRKIFADESNLSGLWTVTGGTSINHVDVFYTSIINITDPTFSYYYFDESSKNNRNVAENSGYFHANNGVVQISNQNNDECPISFFKSGTWDYHIVNSVLVIINDVTWPSFFIRETN